MLSYGPDSVDIFHRSAAYVDRIFKGANPGELPVEGATFWIERVQGPNGTFLQLQYVQTVLLDFKVEQEDTVYPMVAAGASLNDMIRRPSPIVETAADE